MDIKPIETYYNGYRFRSRAEARWAVFFDAAGISYQYEPEGLKLSDGTLYLPDFYLPDCDTWFEVKGVLEKSDAHKIDQLMHDTGRPVVIGYADMKFDACDNWEDGFTRAGADCSILCRCNKCGKLWFMGGTGYFECLNCGYYDGDGGFDEILYGDLADPFCKGAPFALQKARQARFEHKEAPR